MLWQGNTLGDWLQKSGARNTQVVKYIEVFSNDISNLATHESIPMTIMPEGRIVWFGGDGGESNSPDGRQLLMQLIDQLDQIGRTARQLRQAIGRDNLKK